MSVSYLDTVGVSSSYDYLFKVLVIGDSAVGKSSIVERYVEDHYDAHFISTIGVDFKIKTFEWNGKIIKLQLWDTAGQERFRAITASYYRGANGIMLVYDVTVPESILNITKVWMREVGMYARPEVKLMLVGNKSDLRSAHSERVAATRTAVEEFCAMYPNVRHVETSARIGENIEDAFIAITQEMIAQDITGHKLKRHDPDSHISSLTGTRLSSSGTGCCGI